MQAIILVAGKSSRMYPFSDYVHKSLIEIGGKTILSHTLSSVKKAGIKDVILVVSNENVIRESIKNDVGINITFVLQKEATGAGDALLLCESYIEDSFFLLNAGRIDFHLFKEKMLDKLKSDVKGVLLACKEEEITKYGILKIKGETVEAIIEKPSIKEAPTNLRIVGTYLFTKEFLKYLSRVPKVHYSLELAIDQFAKEKRVKFVPTTEKPTSIKYPWDLLALKTYILSKKTPMIAKTAAIGKDVVVEKGAIIDEGAKIMEGAVIKKGCYIGKNAYIGTRSIIRNYSSIEQNASVGAQMEVKNTLLMDYATTHSGFIGDSIIGKKSKIAAFFCSGNVRLDRKPIRIKLGEKTVETNLSSLGVLMGTGVVVGIRVSTMPGVTIGKESIIGPSTIVMQNIPDHVRYYTVFKQVIEEKEKKQKKLVLFDIDYTLFDTDIFKSSKLSTFQLYEEVEDVLDALQNTTIGIFSEGDLAFQKAKLLKTKIHRRFHEQHIHIAEKKEEELTELLKKYKEYKIFFVDDKLPILFAAKKLNPNLFTIWVKRGIFAENQQPFGFNPDAQVKDLRGIIPVIQQE